MSTGEYPRVTGEHAINERTPVPLKLVLTLLAIAAIAGSSHWRIGENEKDIAETKAEVKTINSAREAQGNSLTEMKAKVENIEESTKRIEKTLERMIDGRPVRRASSRGDE